MRAISSANQRQEAGRAVNEQSPVSRNVNHPFAGGVQSTPYSFSLNRSCTSFGFNPFACFITIPTSAPKAACLPAR